MPDIQLSFAITAYDRVMPMISGEVKPGRHHARLPRMPGAVPRVFYEQIKFHRYDVSEMSMSSYLRMRPLGFPYRMLPVFHNRTFSYTNVYTRKASASARTTRRTSRASDSASATTSSPSDSGRAASSNWNGASSPRT